MSSCKFYHDCILAPISVQKKKKTKKRTRAVYSYTLPAEMFRLILKENSFQFNGKHYLQTHGTAMGTKTAVSFANIFMAHIETTILSRTVFKATVWKRYIDDIFFLWDISKRDIEAFIEQANLHHPTVKFTAQICDTETT